MGTGSNVRWLGELRAGADVAAGLGMPLNAEAFGGISEATSPTSRSEIIG